MAHELPQLRRRRRRAGRRPHRRHRGQRPGEDQPARGDRLRQHHPVVPGGDRRRAGAPSAPSRRSSGSRAERGGRAVPHRSRAPAAGPRPDPAQPAAGGPGPRPARGADRLGVHPRRPGRRQGRSVRAPPVPRRPAGVAASPPRQPAQRRRAHPAPEERAAEAGAGIEQRRRADRPSTCGTSSSSAAGEALGHRTGRPPWSRSSPWSRRPTARSPIDRSPRRCDSPTTRRGASTGLADGARGGQDRRAAPGRLPRGTAPRRRRSSPSTSSRAAPMPPRASSGRSPSRCGSAPTAWSPSRVGVTPVLLLDDIFSELDPAPFRRAAGPPARPARRCSPLPDPSRRAPARSHAGRARRAVTPAD